MALRCRPSSSFPLNPKIMGSLTLKRPEGRAPTNRQLVDALGGPDAS